MIFLVFCIMFRVGEFEKKNGRDNANLQIRNSKNKRGKKKRKAKWGKVGGMELLTEIFRIRHTFWLK